MERNSTREQNQQFQIRNKEEIIGIPEIADGSTREREEESLDFLPEFIEAVLDGTQNVQQAAAKKSASPVALRQPAQRPARHLGLGRVAARA